MMALLVTAATSQAEHGFWDKRNLIATAAHAAVRTADVHSTCRFLRKGTERELILPVRGCRSVAVVNYGMVGAELGLRYWLHKTDRHGLERWLPYVFAVPTGIAAGLNYRF